eukprot:c17365_g1_i4 orf=85-1374(+)
MIATRFVLVGCLRVGNEDVIFVLPSSQSVARASYHARHQCSFLSPSFTMRSGCGLWYRGLCPRHGIRLVPGHAATFAVCASSLTRTGLSRLGFAARMAFRNGREIVPEAASDNCTRVLFSGVNFPAAFEYTKEYLQPYDFIQVDAVPHEEIPDKIRDYDICVVRLMHFDSELIARAKKLKLLVQFGVGLEGVDIESATQAGVKVARIPSGGSGNALSCAEHAIYLILGLLRDQKGMNKTVQERKVGEPIGQTLFGKTVFIVGYGNIGKELASRLSAFGVYILATKRSWDSKSEKGELVNEKGGVDCLLKFASRADIVVTCCQLTSETKGMINERFLAALKKGAILINIARGGLLEYNAVKSYLESNHLGGLGMDVAWLEPFDPSDPILHHPKVLITPHIAGVTEISYRNMAKVISLLELCLVKFAKGSQ